jgi:hypothetical protein
MVILAEEVRPTHSMDEGNDGKGIMDGGSSVEICWLQSAVKGWKRGKR